eukprot:scaffold1618_cov397-Prasinococcus_capsulatus_cf.AAC.8
MRHGHAGLHVPRRLRDPGSVEVSKVTAMQPSTGVYISCTTGMPYRIDVGQAKVCTTIGEVPPT